MHFNLVTLFPEFFQSPLSCGLLNKALEQGLVSFSTINPRNFSIDRHRSVDDRPYGGGPGMVMSPQPLARALDSLNSLGKLIMLTPEGEPFGQRLAEKLRLENQITLICGRYEGIDARVEDLYPIHKVSIGDFVLTGGESAALCLIEAVSRLLTDYLGSSSSAQEESFTLDLLEYPHYTRPALFQGREVPEVLLSGHHAQIKAWRRRKSLLRTMRMRPDLLERARLWPGEYRVLRQENRTKLGRNLYIALVHYPVVNKYGQTSTVSLTNLDIHDISRVCRSYGLGGFYLLTPLRDQQVLAQRLIDHWKYGSGAEANPDRVKALRLVQIVDDFKEAVQSVASLTGQRPYVVGTSAQDYGQLNYKQVKESLETKPVLLLFGTGYGLASELLEQTQAVLRPLRYLDDYNHLSVRSAVSITVDRVLGDIY
ncbi:MAG TPA: tRNA (guanosine(37)-N1)-methyltransferase TrmD [Desulfohalobiaceae bacterium]|nr:tRNA (guanosine(37)-N1)-methyltransferase TrmD [Desulfohalobiaceae bacterium]